MSIDQDLDGRKVIVVYEPNFERTGIFSGTFGKFIVIIDNGIRHFIPSHRVIEIIEGSEVDNLPDKTRIFALPTSSGPKQEMPVTHRDVDSYHPGKGALAIDLFGGSSGQIQDDVVDPRDSIPTDQLKYDIDLSSDFSEASQSGITFTSGEDSSGS